MKKLVNPLSGGGAPIYGTETFSEILTQEVWDAMEAILGSLTPSQYSTDVTTDNIVISGGEITDIGGGQFDVAAGIAYFKSAGGAIARFPAATGVTPTVSTIYINLGVTILENKVFFDTTSKNYSETQSAAVATSHGGAEHVTGFATTGGATFFPTLQWALDQVAAEAAVPQGDIAMIQYQIGTWNMDTVATYDEAIAASGNIAKDKIVSVNAIIREDSTTSRQQFKIDQWDGSSAPSGDIQVIENDGDDGFTIRLSREVGGLFDGTRFDGTTDNRGYIILHYDNS